MKLISKNCDACGDLIEVEASEHRRGWGRFCDLKCAGAWRKGLRPADLNEQAARQHPWARAMMEKLAAKYPDGRAPIAPSPKSQLFGHPTRKRRSTKDRQ